MSGKTSVSNGQRSAVTETGRRIGVATETSAAEPMVRDENTRPDELLRELQALRRSEANLRDFVETAAIGLHWVSGEGAVLWANQAELDLLGYTREEYIGHHIGEFHADQSVIEDILACLIRGETLREYPARLRRKDGSIRDVLINSSVLFEDGKFVHTRCFTRDITERKRVEALLREREEEGRRDVARMKILQEVSARFGVGFQLREMAETSLDAAIALTGAHRGHVQLVDTATGTLRIFAQRGFQQPFLDFFNEVHDGHATCGAELQCAERVIVDDVRTSDLFVGHSSLEVMLEAGVLAVISTPLKTHSGRVVGMLSTHFDTPHRPETRAFQLLDVLARQTADFIERCQTENALRESEERYRALYAALPVAAFVCDRNAVIQNYNNRAVELWGRSPKTGVEQHCGSIKLILPDGTWLPHAQSPMVEVLRTGIPVRNVEVFIERTDGSRLPVIVNFVALKDATGEIVGAVTSFDDITERQQAEKAVRESAERLRFMAESMPQKIFTATRTGEVDYFNLQWMEFTGLSFEQIKDWGWTQFIHPDDVEENVRLWQHSIDTGELFEFVHRFRRADGAYRWHLSRAQAMRDAKGKITMWIGSNTDIHEEKQTEEELRRANEDLNLFAFAASHDLQEPLRMITSYSQLLVKEHRDAFSQDAEAMVGFIADGTKRMRELLADLLAYTAVGAEQEQSTDLIDLNGVLGKVLKNLKPAIGDSNASISIDPLPQVRGAEAHFIQLFQNLIGNAIKYRSGQPPAIHVSAVQLNEERRFEVSDNGIGIAPEYHEKVFAVFKRLHGKKIPGTGVGLAICKRVVERQGGRIWVESQLGQGATFYFTVPVTRGDR